MPTFWVQTFGCQMNAHDSDRMSEVLVSHGWLPSIDVEEADLIVFNTCSVREKAEQKLRSEVGKLAPLKQRKPDVVIAVAGCVAQQEGEKLLSRIDHIDLVVGPDNLAELPMLALEQRAGALPRVSATFDLGAPKFLSASPGLVPGRGRPPVGAYVTTMKGCDERCSFCVVPYTRGPERYRPAREILDEVARWVEAGSREVTLLGQTVDSYRDPSLPPPVSDDPDESQFPALLRAIAREVPTLARLRYTSPHPRHATASLAEAHADLDVLARHVHMPVQSGSDRMLKRMIRRYTRAEYIQRTTRLKNARAGMTLSTDVIVGFSGETDEDFALTLSLVREMGFTSLFGFKYSPRPLTPALKLPDDVPESQKSDRLAQLFEVAESNTRAHLATMVGTRQSVLVEGASKNGGRVQGRTERNEIVHVDVAPGIDFVGAIVEVEIVRANKHSLEGMATDACLEALALRSANASANANANANAPPSPSPRHLPLL
jgi:tRNA-2-methylthio-N6-dimethylallyladenosine synthase